jgi:cyanophycin synthetase
LKSILFAGVKIQLRGNSNLGTGGTLEDVTVLLDEETKGQCIATAKRMGL